MIMMTASSVSRIGAAMPYDGRDRDDLDRSDGERQQERPVGFAETPHKAFRVADDAQGRPERRYKEPEKDRGQDQRIVEAREKPVFEQSKGGHGRCADKEEPFGAQERRQAAGGRSIRSWCKEVFSRHAGFALRQKGPSYRPRTRTPSGDLSRGGAL
jgi:hypothetical protein